MTVAASPDRCRFKDLCLDVADVDVAAAFWSAALGLSAGRGGTVLGDDEPTHTVWLNAVPEAKTVKHRVHLDLHVAAVADLVNLGARVLHDDQPWTVLADPEGGEFCAFVRPPERLPSYRLYEVVVDAVEARAIAGWWAERFGVVAEQEDPESFCWLPAEGGLPWDIIFTPVPEPKQAKNRVHWDVTGDTAGLVAAGATLLRRRTAQRDWDVLADPEGNEFCVFPTG